MNEELEALLEGIAGYAAVTASMKERALSMAQIPDATGVWPGQPGYAVTTDAYYAALQLLPFLQARPLVTSTSSEGTSVSVTPPDWQALRSFFRDQSVIIAASGHDVLRAIPIPDPPHVKRVPMNDTGGRYGDVDTDVN